MQEKIQIFQVENAETVDQVRKLFLQYGIERTFDKALGDYQKEMLELPGKYGSPSGLLVIGKVGGIPAGCIAFQQLDLQTCEMKRLYVLPKFRKLGLGKLLISFLINSAIGTGYTMMKLDSHPSMHAAQNLYKHFGFKSTTRYNQNPIEGILFFEKSLIF